MTDPAPAFDDEPPRAVAHVAWLVLGGFMVVASLLLSERAPTLARFNVAPGGPVPAGVPHVFGNDWSLVIHRSDWRPAIAKALGRTDEEQPLRLGWVVREWSFLGLPLFAYRPSGLAAYRTDRYGYRVSALIVDEVAAIRARGGPG